MEIGHKGGVKIDSDTVIQYTALRVTYRGTGVMQDPTHSAPPRLQSALNVDVLALVADSVICTDENGRILVFNKAAEQSFGHSASEVIGQPVEMLLPLSDRSEHVSQVHNFALGDGAANRLMGHRREVRGRRKNGQEFPAEAMVSRQTVDGKTILTVVHRDITERKELEELREAIGREVDHRMRNLLSVVSSLISLSAASAVTVDEFKESLTGRMRALAVAQSALRLGERSTSLSELFQAELAQYQTSDGANVTIEGASFPVGLRAAQMLALAVHELATNSAKYGALSSVGGCVAVTSAIQGEGENSVLVIKWEETGGPPVSPPTSKGFGTTLIEKVVARALRADVALEYQPQGLVCRMTLPKTALEAEH